jgi:hypothetical protein
MISLPSRPNNVPTYLDNALARESRTLAPHGRTTVTTIPNQSPERVKSIACESHIPEVGDDLVASVGYLLVLLRRALGNLEAIL